MGDVSGSVVNAVVELTRARAGSGGVAQVLALADERRDFARLSDPGQWSSLEQVVALFNAASLVNEDGAVALHVGEHLMTDAEDLDGLVGIAEVLGAIRDVLARFDETASATPVEIAQDHALVRVTPRPGTHRHAHLCEMTRGMLSSLPTLSGGPPAFVTESECAARGGRFCLYAVSWERPAQTDFQGSSNALRVGPDVAPPDVAGSAEPDETDEAPPDAEPDEWAGSGPDDRTVHLAGTNGHSFATTTARSRNGAHARDPDPRFERIAARADIATGQAAYVLALRIGPDGARHVHSRGLGPAEVDALVEEPWQSHPSDDPGRFVVDVASDQRHYGRLVVVLPDGERPAPDLVRNVRLFVDYAAAALSVDDVRAEARRDSATARVMLAFSERLSQVTDLAEAVQLVVDTVPPLTGTDRSTLYLWNENLGHLVPRARTTGREADGSFEGIYAVTARDDHPAVTTLPRGTLGDETRETSAGADPGETERADDGAPSVMTVPRNAPLTERLIQRREVIVIERDVDDPALRRLLADNGAEAAVVAPLFAAGQFIGILSASFAVGTPPASYRDPAVHERLARLADQAATALQNLDLLDKISHLAWHDALTGLPNRRLFKDRVDQELIRSRRVGEPVCMFFVDLDRFKHVNDTLGHAAGDELIQEVGARLVDTVRSQDTVARVGGDEFAVLLPGLADQLDIDQLAARMLEALAEPADLSEERVRTTASIGIAVAPEHGDTYDELLSRADEAMYRAKALGRNGFQMYRAPSATEGDQPADIDQRSLYRDLVHALDSDQFFVVYQPYVDLRTTEVIGVEALLRWQHPTYGVLEAPTFVPLAERSDAIVALDTRVLEEACAQLREWTDAGLPSIRLSVNLSSRDLEDPAYADTIARILAEHGIDPRRLELDVTERVEVEDDTAARDNIDRLRRLGARFTVDDFGTANSSLARLGAFPVSTLKIDRSFVQVLDPGGDADELVAAIVDMAERLGLDCVAEGVETRTQSRVLLQRGCTTAQGYFLCPPMTAEELEAALTVVGSPPVQPGSVPGAPPDERV